MSDDIWDKLTVELSESERRDEWGDLSSTISYKFLRRRDGTGNLVVSEQWDAKHEIWSSGVSISLPPRVLTAFLEWVATPPLVGESNARPLAGPSKPNLT